MTNEDQTIQICGAETLMTNTHSHNARWRVGRSLGRTIYVQTGDEPAKGDTFVGIMDTPELAALIVGVLNDYGVEPLDDADDQGWDERTQNAPGRYGA